jgi:hypothetical protein
VTSEPGAPGVPRPEAPGRQQGTPGSAAPGGWARRLVHGLVLLDSWYPAGGHPGSPQAARRHLRGEWTRSGDLTERQAAVLVTLEETTAWSA